MIIYKCDNCGCEIPIIKKQLFGSEIEVLDRGYLDCKEIDLKNVAKYSSAVFCKSCAMAISNQIDSELLKFKISVLDMV